LPRVPNMNVWVLSVRPYVKVSRWFNSAPRHEGILGEWRYSSTHSLTSALDGGEWSASRPVRFILRERAPGTHWIGGWVGPRAVLDAVVKRKISSPRLESNARTPNFQPVAQRYTDWTITVPRPYVAVPKLLNEFSWIFVPLVCTQGYRYKILILVRYDCYFTWSGNRNL
jgi:hypothetical protein